MTRNKWIQHTDTVVQWYARLDGKVREPEVALSMLARVASAGLRSGMLVCEPASLAAVRDDMARTNKLRFSLERTRPAANLCWYGADDSLKRGLVRDLGQLLSSLPEGAETVYADYRAQGRPPVSVWGGRIDLDEEWPEHLNLCVSLYSDIWMPFVKGLSHPNYREDAYFDNSELAMCHTPRFN